MSEQSPSRVVVLGASAGGLAAIKGVLEGLPDETGFAFVVIQHVGPDSILAEILVRFTKMPVHIIEDGMRLRANHIYVNAPKTDVSLSGDVLSIIGKEREYGKPRRCIDYFMCSLAEHKGAKSIGVVLSGNLRDGSEGLCRIKSASGITFAQDASAEWKDMPENAIETGCVDFVLPPAEIAASLGRLAKI